MADLDRYNRRRGDLRNGCCQTKHPEGSETTKRSHSDLATPCFSQSCRGADVASRIPSILHRNGFSVGGLRLLRQFRVYPPYAPRPGPYPRVFARRAITEARRTWGLAGMRAEYTN